MVDINFNFLRILDIPQKYPISHNLVSRLLEKSENLKHEIILNKDELNHDEYNILDAVKRFSTKEEAFIIVKNEYEMKEIRFLKLTNYNSENLDLMYSNNNLHFNDIHSQKIEQIIEKGDLNSLIDILNLNGKIIEKTTENCYGRINLLLDLWKDKTTELQREINNFEHRGLKMISNNFRVRLLPQLELMKSELKPQLHDDSRSRSQIEDQLRSIVEQAEIDLLQELTPEQIKLFDKIESSPDLKSLISMLKDESTLNNLIELILSDFIKISIVKRELKVI